MKPECILDFHSHFPAKNSLARRELHPLVRAYAKELKEDWRETFDFPEPERKRRGIIVVCTELGVSQEEMNAIFYSNGAKLLSLEDED